MADCPTIQLSRDEMRQFGYRVIDMLIEHVETLPDKPVSRRVDRMTLESRLREPPPEASADPLSVLDQLEREVFSAMMHVDHPRFFAFVPGPGNYVGALADALAAGFNVFAGTWFESSGPAEIELVTVDWLRAACGLPETAGGLFVSGGSMANITALAVARHVRLAGRADGVVYCSDQTHSSVERGLRVLGFGPDLLRKLPSDVNFRLDLEVVRRAVAEDRVAGRTPFCVVANAGTTNTGAIDPLPALAGYCRDEDLWLHIDGAFGAAAVLCERGQALLQGLGEAHSLALDPHKWLFQPFEIGCVLVRESGWLEQAFHILPEYLADASGHSGEVNFCDRGIQLTRAFRALKLWMSVKVFGWQAFRAAIAGGIERAELVEQAVRALPDWEVTTPAQMAVVTFRYAPPGLPADRLNALNQALVNHLVSEGFALVTSTALRGQTVLRVCTINPRTTESDVLDTVRCLDETARRLS